jgi:hypothetical protein
LNLILKHLRSKIKNISLTTFGLNVIKRLGAYLST